MESREIFDDFAPVSSQKIAEGAIFKKKQGQNRGKILDSEGIKPKLEVIMEDRPGRFHEVFMKVEYLPSLEFANRGVHRAINRRALRLIRKKKISSGNEWLLALYQKEMEQNAGEEKIEIRWIGREIGYGIFAKKDLPEFTYLGEYTGQVRRRKLFADQKNNYCFRYQIGPYLSRFVIDAKKKGNLTRFINHSDEPNVKPHSLVTPDGMGHIIVCTSRFVAEGEQLAYDYGPDFWRRRRKIP